MTEKKFTNKSKEEIKLNTELEDKYIKKISVLKDEEDHGYADELLSSFIEELGYTRLADVYRKVPMWFEWREAYWYLDPSDLHRRSLYEVLKDGGTPRKGNKYKWTLKI